MRDKGRIAAWNHEKGYGFIEPINGGPQVFIHIKAISNCHGRPEVGETVNYAVTKDDQGRVRAQSATVAGTKRAGKTAHGGRASATILSLFFLATVCTSASETNLPIAIPAAYVFISLITFTVYAIDKTAARKGRWRTSEGTLHLLALTGGWPGALIAQQTLRHKTSKTSFRIVFWTTVLINIAAIVWLHTADGRNSLGRLLALIEV